MLGACDGVHHVYQGLRRSIRAGIFARKLERGFRDLRHQRLGLWPQSDSEFRQRVCDGGQRFGISCRFG